MFLNVRSSSNISPTLRAIGVIAVSYTHLDLFKEDEYEEPAETFTEINLEEVLKELLDEAVKRGIIEDSVVYLSLIHI